MGEINHRFQLVIRISLGPSIEVILGDLREFDGQGGYSTLVGGFKHFLFSIPSGKLT